jgi:hypothetical protein
VLGVSNLHISTIFLFDAGIVPTVRYILFSFYDVSKAFLLFNKNNRKRKSYDFCIAIGQWPSDHRQKGINKPKRGYCFTMEQTSFGRMKSFIFLYI